MSSVIRQNYREDCEASINNQINMKLYVSYVYMSMSYYYDRADVALPGMAKFFKKNSDEERDHAEKLMKYQNSRGGRIALKAIAEPKRKEWGSALDGLQTALDLEKQVNKDLLDLHALGGTANDPHLTEFLEDEYLSEQVEAIKKLGDMITKLKRAGPTGVGEYLFDTELQS